MKIDTLNLNTQISPLFAYASNDKGQGVFVWVQLIYKNWV